MLLSISKRPRPESLLTPNFTECPHLQLCPLALTDRKIRRARSSPLLNVIDNDSTRKYYPLNYDEQYSSNTQSPGIFLLGQLQAPG